MLRWILVNMTKAIAPVRPWIQKNKSQILSEKSLTKVLCHLAEDIWQFLPPGEEDCLVRAARLRGF